MDSSTPTVISPHRDGLGLVEHTAVVVAIHASTTVCLHILDSLITYPRQFEGEEVIALHIKQLLPSAVTVQADSVQPASIKLTSGIGLAGILLSDVQTRHTYLMPCATLCHHAVYIKDCMCLLTLVMSCLAKLTNTAFCLLCAASLCCTQGP